ncbi:hypothetical protein BGZ83_005653 [Gryganskiella cystojenkinii]|nr:hypothetical protein BGZ83_005653 [Gryganskiella cystojenkinii]
MSTNKGKGRKGARIDAAAERAGVSPAYYEELQDTFKLFDTESIGTLSVKKLRLAMRTLGFEATVSDIDEIVQATAMLSVHQRRKHQKQRKQGGKGQGTGAAEPSRISTTKAQPQRRSTRAAAIAAALDAQPKYVDSDDNEGEANPSDSDDSDPDDEFYNGERGKPSSNSADDGLYFTFEDFVLIMSPKEEQHAWDEVSRVFSLFDTQGKGIIGLEDLRRVASELGMPMKDQELQEMIEEASKDGHDGVTEQEFGKLLKKCGF